MKRAIILLTTLGLLLGACGGGGTKKEANGDMKAKLLTAADLPDGFKRTKAEETAPSKDTSGDTETCKELDDFDKTYSGERDAEADFEKSGASGYALLNESIKRFKDDDTAGEAFTAFEAGVEKCTSFSTTNDDGSTTTGSFEKTDFARVGDGTYATALTITQGADGQTASLDGFFIAMRKGNHIFLLMSIGLGDKVTKAELESVAKKAVARF